MKRQFRCAAEKMLYHSSIVDHYRDVGHFKDMELDQQIKKDVVNFIKTMAEEDHLIGVSQPYESTYTSIRKAVRICEEKDWKFRIFGASSYKDTTFVVVFYEKEANDKFEPYFPEKSLFDLARE